MPSSPYDAKGMLLAAIEDDNPVVFLEHRWLHPIKGHVPEGHYTVPIGPARMARADHGQLHLAHVIERIPGGSRLGGQDVFLTEFEIDARIVRQSEELARQTGVRAEVHLIATSGQPAKQLAALTCSTASRIHVPRT